MSKTIPEPLIREVRERTDIVDVIGEVVELKKQGQDRYVGLCPFHGENTPSFSVSKDRQLYHCFGCKASGNVVSFLIDHGKLSFQEAIMKLADNLNIDTQHVELSPEPTSEGEKMREGHSLAARFYHHLLMNTEQGRAAYQYFKERGVNEEAMLHFRLGYAPRERSSLKTLLDKREFDLKLMANAGLLQVPEDGRSSYDRFSDRVMFPLHDIGGKHVGFNARALVKDNHPKYLNSPESALFKKSNMLYAYHLAKPVARKKDQVVLFEGCMDVVSAWIHGIDNGIATLGTAMNQSQAKRIRNLTENVILCYDGDQAGEEAAIKNAETLQGVGCDVRVVPMPEGKDPDEFLTEYGSKAFVHLIENEATAVSSFKIARLRREKNLQREGDRREYIERVLEIVLGVESAIEREYFMKDLSQEFDISLDALHQELTSIEQRRNHTDSVQSRSFKPRAQSAPQKAQVKRELLPAFHRAERMLIRAMIDDEQWADEVKDHIGGEFNVDQYAAIAAYLYAFYADGHEASSHSFIMHMDDRELQQIATEIMMESGMEMTKEAFTDYIELVKNYPTWVEIEGKEHELKDAERRKDIEAALKIGNEIIALKKRIGGKFPKKRTNVR
ncbi:DNA primase [Geomicrobium sp. JSM 1781026]|uniref:DNA primase n=1 Tax=Geomicrobium sp. JSM 1781026 TaxID=3344580 RepID=UPI0035C1BE40